MRDDQRPDREKQDDVNERFDEALDDLFGPDDEPLIVSPQTGGQQPQPAGGSSPPRDASPPDPQHPSHPPHQIDDDHVFGPGNAPPPDSYGMPSRAQREPAGQDEPPVMAAGEPERPTAPASAPPQDRNWRRIGCYGCLVLVGLPALCLGALIVLGLIVGEETGTPTPVSERRDGPAIENPSVDTDDQTGRFIPLLPSTPDPGPLIVGNSIDANFSVRSSSTLGCAPLGEW